MWQFVDLGETAERLRGHPEINEVAGVRAPHGHLYILVEPQGMLYGTMLRDIVLDAVEEEYPDVAVAMVTGVPRNSSGVDPAAVAELGRQVVEGGRWVFAVEPPETGEEKALVALLLEILDVRRVSMTDNLQLLGADSLVLVELSGMLADRFGVTVTVMELFDARDVREVAKLLSGAGSRGTS